MFIIYAIYNYKHKKIYVGQTRNLYKRLKIHNTRKFVGCFTSRYDGEWKLVYQENAASRKKALEREKQLKSYQGREFIRQFI